MVLTRWGHAAEQPLPRKESVRADDGNDGGDYWRMFRPACVRRQVPTQRLPTLCWPRHGLLTQPPARSFLLTGLRRFPFSHTPLIQPTRSHSDY